MPVHTNIYKLKLVREVMQGGRSVPSVAKEAGISAQSLYKWCEQLRDQVRADMQAEKEPENKTAPSESILEEQASNATLDFFEKLSAGKLNTDIETAIAMAMRDRDRLAEQLAAKNRHIEFLNQIKGVQTHDRHLSGESDET